MSISLLYLHLDLTSLYLRKRALWGQTKISLLSLCSACPGAVRMYVRHGGACRSEASAGVGVGGCDRTHARPLPTSLTSCFLQQTSFMEMLTSFSSRTWHLPTLPKVPKPGSMAMGLVCLIGQQTHLT